MNLQQLSNLIDTWGGDHFDPQNRWNEEVVFMSPDGKLHTILSMTWAAEEDKWVLCAEIPDEDFDV